MKKLLAYLAITLLAIAALGCAGGGQTNNAPMQAQSASPAQVYQPASPVQVNQPSAPVQTPRPTPAPPPAPEPYFTGDGGRGMRLAVLEPSLNGLSADEQKWMPLTIQGSITGDFNRYSGMTIIDRQNFERILAEQNLSMSGYFSDVDYIRIGHLTNTRYILWGNVTKTASAYMLELGVTDAETGERRASYPPKQVTSQALENLTAVKEATADLLEQMGVSLTSRGRQELSRPPPAAEVQAENSLSRAITANRQGSIVEAMHYLSEAVSFDPQLTEANQRLSALNSRINAGDIGENIRNDIQLRNAWDKLLGDAIAFYYEHPYFNVVYNTRPSVTNVNYTRNTATIEFECWLEANEAGVKTVFNLIKALVDTGKISTWDLVRKAGSLLGYDFYRFIVSAELLDDNGLSLGVVSIRFDMDWQDSRFPGSGRSLSKLDRIFFLSRNDYSLQFTNVNADRISDGMTLKFTRAEVSTVGYNAINNISVNATTRTLLSYFTGKPGYSYTGRRNEYVYRFR